MIKYKINNNSFLIRLLIVLVWVIWLSAYPSVFSYVTGIPFMIPILFSLCLIIGIFLYRKKVRYNKNHLLLFLCLFGFWFCQLIFRIDSSYVSNIFQVFTVLIVYLVLYNYLDIEDIVKQYIRFMIIISILGAISFFVVLLLNLTPSFSFLAHDGRYNNFFFLTFSNTYFPTPNGTIIRFSGVFDEPGTLTFYATYALMMNRLLLKNKKDEILLLTVPLLAMSMAYFITVFLYVLFFYIKSFKAFFVILICTLSLLFAIQNMKGTDLHRVYQLTIERFEQDDSGELKGNNRYELIEGAKEYIKKNPLFGFGKTFFEQQENYIGANILYIGALYGVIGYIFVFIFFWYAISICLFGNRIFIDGLKCCLIISVNYLQRPDVTNILQLSSLLLFALCIYYWKYNPQILNYNKLS